MENRTIFSQVVEWAAQSWLWAIEHLFNLESLVQLVVIAAIFTITSFLKGPVGKRLVEREELPVWLNRIRNSVERLLQPLLWLIIQLVFLAVARGLGFEATILEVTTSLLAAWFIVHLMATPVRNRVVANLISGLVWIVAALFILNLLDTALLVLDAAAIPIGEDQNVSLLDLVQGLLSLAIAVWIAVVLANIIEERANRADTLNPSAVVLISKGSRIVLIGLAILVGLAESGIDLTVFAVVGGTLGLGIGFGLQKVVSNLFSGLILLVDRSVKPGDVIEIQGTYGSVNKLAARYTSVITRNGTEYLIPNEDMITQPVVNWSHTNDLVRQKIVVGISYNSDLNLARDLTIKAALTTERVLERPAPVCLLTEFGDSSLNLELRFWIRDPSNGVANVCSEVRLKIWEKFNENNISIPFPQRDVHILDALDNIAGSPGDEQ